MRRIFFLLAIAFAIERCAFGQLPDARLSSVFPPGAQAGATVDVAITGGEDLEEISGLRFSHPGIQAKPKIPEGQTEPVANTFEVTVAGDVPPGTYEVYAGGYFGWSSPRTFVVGQRPEVVEAEPNNEPDKATQVETSVTMNGRLEQAADLDYVRFMGRKGTRVVADCRALRIDSRMAPVIEIYDLRGRKLAHVRGARHDATLLFDPPEDGEYLLKLFDETYRGGADYFYRLSLHTGPHVAFALPPAGAAGTTARFRLFGFNLPGGQPTDQLLDGMALERLDVDVPVPADATVLDVDERVAPVEAGMDAFTWRLNSPQGVSNPVRLHIARARAALEQEPNDDLASPQSISVPCDLGGQFATVGDSDAFTFDVKQGAVWWVEVYGERIDSDVDPLLIVEHVGVDGDGKETVNRLTVQDDIGIDLAPNAFDTQTDDASFRYVAPADGRCRIVLKDRYGGTRGDPALIYRLVVRPESPDFRLVAVPTQAGVGQAGSTTLRKGDDFSFSVLAFRRHGFNGAIDVRAEGLPAGVTCTGTVIGPNQTSAPLVLTTSVDVPDFLTTIRLIGHAGLSSPPLVQAQQNAHAAMAAAAKPLGDLRKAADEETKKLQQAVEEVAAALKAVDEKPEDGSLRDQLAEKQKVVEPALAAQKQSTDKLLQAQKAADDARAAWDQAKAAASAAIVQADHPVRFATVVWSTQNNRPAFSRVARELLVSTMKDVASYQIRPGVQKVEVRQGGLVLVPVQLERRNGFDAEVPIAINGRPDNSNIDGANFKFEKGAGEFLLPLFVKENSPPDAYAISLTGQAQVSYRRNPEKAERAKAAFDQQDAAAKTAQAAAQQAEQAKNDANQKATAAGQAMEQAQQANQKAAEELKGANDRVAQAKTNEEEAGKKADAATAALKDAETALEAAKKEQEAAPDNADLAQKVKQAEESVTTARQASEQAEAEKAASATTLTDAETAAAKAAEEQQRSEQGLKEATAAKTAADEAKTAAEAAENEAKKKSQEQDEKRKQAEKTLNEANKAAEAKNLNFNPNSPPIVIVVKPAPVKLSANGGEVKRGQTLEIKTTLTRQNSFSGPATLTLVLPPGVAGLAAEPVVVSADQSEGTLKVTAAADATEGDLKNIVVRALTEFDGPAPVDALVGIKVVP
jgi:hypothetical protein